jgi:hypothetical protein
MLSITVETTAMQDTGVSMMIEMTPFTDPQLLALIVYSLPTFAQTALTPQRESPSALFALLALMGQELRTLTLTAPRAIQERSALTTEWFLGTKKTAQKATTVPILELLAREIWMEAL